MKKLIILFLSLILSHSSLAAEEPNYGFFMGIQGGTTEEKTSDETKFTGSTYGLNFGYRWVHFVLEAAYSKYNFTADKGRIEVGGMSADLDKGEITATSFDIILRWIFLRYFTFAFGFSGISTQHDIRYSNINNDPSNNYTFDQDASYSGALINFGLVLPLLRNLDLRLLAESRSWKSDPIIIGSGMSFSTMELELKFVQYSGQLIYYFD